MIYLLYATGLRVSELVGLTLHKIETEQGYVRVQGKGDKERIAPFASVAGDKLRDYLDHHRANLHPKDQAAFINHSGDAISRQTFWKTLSKDTSYSRIIENCQQRSWAPFACAFSQRWVTEPALPTMRQPLAAVGAEMVRLLLGMIYEGRSPQSVILPTEMVIRDSA